MTPKNYWLDLFTPTTRQQFNDAGASVSGFRESCWKILQKVKKGDYFLCYLTGISRWVGVLEVVSEPFKDTTQIWEDEDFPCRVKVRVIAALTPKTGIPVMELRDRLTVFQNLKADSPLAWTGHFRGSPAKWKPADGEEVVRSIVEASRNPIERAIDPAKLKYRPKPLRAKIGLVTVPEPVEEDASEQSKEPAAHTEIQALLLQLGSDMGFDVWVARNDRSKSFAGKKFAELPRLKSNLPLQFDDATNKTIELIDVLWLRGNAITAAFEIESTTSIYSGLLRMGDLVAMQPNLNIPLYLVAPDERRDKVFAEVNRPTFFRLSPKLAEICRYIPFSALREELSQVQSFVRYLKPDFLDELSELCSVEAD